MTKAKRELYDIRIKKLAKALEGVEPERLRSVLVKDKTLGIRITESDLLEIKATAKACGLTVTEYIERLHWFALDRLGTLGGATKKARKRRARDGSKEAPPSP